MTRIDLSDTHSRAKVYGWLILFRKTELIEIQDRLDCIGYGLRISNRTTFIYPSSDPYWRQSLYILNNERILAKNRT